MDPAIAVMVGALSFIIGYQLGLRAKLGERKILQWWKRWLKERQDT